MGTSLVVVMLYKAYIQHIGNNLLKLPYNWLKLIYLVYNFIKFIIIMIWVRIITL